MLVEEAGDYGNDIFTDCVGQNLETFKLAAHRMTVGLANDDKMLKFHAQSWIFF